MQQNSLMIILSSRVFGRYRQIEYLEDPTIESYEVFIYQGVSGGDIIVKGELQQGANRIIGVER